MGHANSKPAKKKGIEKERSRSRSFIKPKKKESQQNLNNNNNNVSDRNNENDTPTTTSTTSTAPTTPTTASPTVTTTTSSSPPVMSPLSLSTPSSSPPSTPLSVRKLGEKNNKGNDERKLSNGGESSERKLSLRESTVFDEDEKPVELLLDEEVDQQCPLCEEETLSMYSLEVCGHSVCVPCLYAYSEHQLKNLAADAHEILCPVPECTCIISATDLRAALDTFGAPSVIAKNKSTRADGDGADGEDQKERRGSTTEEIGEGGGGEGGDGGEGSSSGSGRRNSEIEEEVGESSSSPSVARRNSVAPSLPIQLTHSLEMLLSKGNYIHCPNPACKFVFEKLPPPTRRKSEVVLDESGNPISPESSKHREEHRFRCRVCGTNFCAACKSVPYHLGFTCKQKIAAMRAKKCRFCEVALPAGAKPFNSRAATPTLAKKKDKAYRRSFLMKWKGKNSKTDLNASEEIEVIEENPKEFFVCKSKECTTKMGQACQRFLECGHVCAGTYSDLASECFCLREGCCPEDKQNGTEYCNICWTEALGSGPCYRLACSHVFHAACISSKLYKEWPGPSISFAFMNCPLCSQVVQHRLLDAVVTPFRNLFEQVKTRALQRLEFEGMLNDPRVTDVASDFYNKPAEYAMSIFSFYKCYICRNPYFGGRRQCEVQQVPEGAEAPAFNPQELQCGGCSTLNAKCAKHGKEYIEYKCRFCCSLATFYCGGKAHFCTTCHDKAGQLVEFINWTTTAKCEPCKGPGLCPLGVQHKDNGEEFSLGCSICRVAGV